jgi:hypothetical protein
VLRLLGPWALLGLALPGAAQVPGHVVQRVHWPLADFVVFGDSVSGVHLIASPDPRTWPALGKPAIVTLRFDAMPARRWAAGVAAVLDSVSRLAPDERSPFHTMPLAASGGRGCLAVGRSPAAPRESPFAVAVLDSGCTGTGAGRGWRSEASADELRDLLTALDGAAQQAPSDADADVWGGDAVYESSGVDRPPELRREAPPWYPLGEAIRGARVLVEFVVDTTGAVLPETFRVILSDGRSFAEVARKTVLRSTFEPGRLHGRPVKVRLWQWLLFNAGE